MILDFVMIVGSMSVIFLEKTAIIIMLPALVAYFWFMEYDRKPRPILVERWNRQAGKFLTYEVDKKTGKYLKRVKE